MSDLRSGIAACATDQAREVESCVSERRYIFPAEFAGFSGHFPGNPIFPAFVQILAASILVEEVLGRPLTLASVERAKFLTVLGPGQEVTIRCRIREAADNVTCDARLTVGEAVASTMTLMFRRSDPTP
jgi:3-hydroxyacyl-[acyl-carrier-protein] dehydratase